MSAIQANIKSTEEYLSILSGLITRHFALMLDLDRRATEIGLLLDGLRGPYLSALKQKGEADSKRESDTEQAEVLGRILELQRVQARYYKEKVAVGRQCMQLVQNVKQVVAETKYAISGQAACWQNAELAGGGAIIQRTSLRAAAVVATHAIQRSLLAGVDETEHRSESVVSQRSRKKARIEI